MSEETVFKTEIRAALESEPAPPVNLAAIYGTAPKARRPSFPAGRIAAVTAASLAAALLLMPQAQAVVQSMESRVEAAMRAMGIEPGPPIPKSIVTTLQSRTHTSSFAQAAKQVQFTLVEPQGLPADVRSEKIYVSPTAQWSTKGRQWQVADKIVTFDYTRSGGRHLILHAVRYDPSEKLSAYMWQPVETASGEPVIVNGKLKLIRYDSLHWRNGDQMTTAIAGEGISLAEAQNIEHAMNGQNLPGFKDTKPHGGHKLFAVKP